MKQFAFWSKGLNLFTTGDFIEVSLALSGSTNLSTVEWEKRKRMINITSDRVTTLPEKVKAHINDLESHGKVFKGKFISDSRSVYIFLHEKGDMELSRDVLTSLQGGELMTLIW